MTEPDVITDVLQRIAEVADVPEEQAKKVEREARQYWGGERPYIPKSGESPRRREASERAQRDAQSALEQDRLDVRLSGRFGAREHELPRREPDVGPERRIAERPEREHERGRIAEHPLQQEDDDVGTDDGLRSGRHRFLFERASRLRSGAIAGRQEDLQSTTLPGQLILMVPYFISVLGGDHVHIIPRRFTHERASLGCGDLHHRSRPEGRDPLPQDEHQENARIATGMEQVSNCAQRDDLECGARKQQRLTPGLVHKHDCDYGK